MLGYYNYTVIATYLSVVSASSGIWLTLGGHPTAAVFCLLISGILDMFDGKIAATYKNRTPEAKRFGIQIDSLSDLLAFGVLPAVIGLYLWNNSIFYMPLAALYILAALIRLAYFNVTEEMRQENTTEVRKFYTGLPVTTAAFTFPLLWCFSDASGDYFKYIFAFLMLIECVLFVSKFKIKKPHGKVFAAICLIGIMLLGLLVYSVATGGAL